MLRDSITAVAGLALPTATALAHHSYSNYDMQTEQSLNVTVERVEWVNPHIIIWLRTSDNKTGRAIARIEGHAPLLLARNGFDRSSINAGNQVRLTIHPLRQGNGGSLVAVTLSDDRSFDRFGVLQDRGS